MPCTNINDTETCEMPVQVELNISDTSSSYIIAVKCGADADVVGSTDREGNGTTVVAMGTDGTTVGTEEYCFGGISQGGHNIPADIPTFEVYDVQRDIYYARPQFRIALIQMVN